MRNYLVNRAEISPNPSLRLMKKEANLAVVHIATHRDERALRTVSVGILAKGDVECNLEV